MTIQDEDVSFEAARRGTAAEVISVITSNRPGDGIVFPTDLPLDPTRLAERVWIVNPLEGKGSQDHTTHQSVHVALWTRTPDVLSACTVALPALSVTMTVHVPAAPPQPVPRDHRVRLAAPANLGHRRDARVSRISALPVGAAVHRILSGELDAAVFEPTPYLAIPNAAYGIALHHGLVVRWTNGRPITFQSEVPMASHVLISRPDDYSRVLHQLR